MVKNKLDSDIDLISNQINKIGDIADFCLICCDFSGIQHIRIAVGSDKTRQGNKERALILLNGINAIKSQLEREIEDADEQN
jgi:hypothetical protein